ncbi:hypothetical protein [Roseiconus lacunae]|uniref:Uncharacterized protein n=1 Tax=Roseiconus lacunae TaxID=2605694 RepID=A0ABT7PH79_9BACT|nr:hypothetical protein [Roseiconus lacunae]MDM4015846.1 hypothetical protein [Roseiconus lacunae]
MPRLGSQYRKAASAASYYHATQSGITITPLGTSDSITCDATIYREKIFSRPDPSSRSGDRQRIATRIVLLPPGSDPIPVLSPVTVDGENYTVEQSRRSSVSGKQVLHLIRTTVDQTSRPDRWH